MSSEGLRFFMSNLLSGAVQIAILRSPLHSDRLASLLCWFGFGETIKSSQPADRGVHPWNMGHGKLVPAYAKWIGESFSTAAK